MPARIAGTSLEKHNHVCAFFNTPDEEYRVLLPFIRDGIEEGEKAFHIVDPALKEDHERRLTVAGIETKKAAEKGQLEVKVWNEAYLRDGRFDQQRMISLIQRILDDGRKGFPLTRLVAHMEWSLLDRPGVNDIIEYESRLNYILPKYKDPVVCTYATSRFSGGVVMDILRTHPMVIVGGVLQENPFYIAPDEFLRELESRAA